jgi:flagellar basal body-associated protein FliL
VITNVIIIIIVIIIVIVIAIAIIIIVAVISSLKQEPPELRPRRRLCLI